MVQTEKRPVDFFENLDQVNDELKRKEVFIFLDYDGTLTPIVDTPDLAVLSLDMRETIKKLSSMYKVSIVSGRATDDVKAKVQLNGIFYAGSHGFEIVHPNGEVDINEEVEAIQPSIDEVYKKFSDQLKDVTGALVEHVKYTISVHYRLVSDEDFQKVEEVVTNILNEHDNLRKTDGKKVFEIRPKIDWHKGKAVEFILKTLNFDSQNNLAIYIGDDTTDEDAFAALSDKGIGILVAENKRVTRAKYIINDTKHVRQVLEFFIKRKS